MAVDFGRVGTDDYASRSASGFNHNAAYTALTWFKIDVDPNDYQHFIHIGGTYSYDGNTDFVGTDNDGQLFRYGCAGGASSSFLTSGYLTIGAWYWCALVRESSTSLKVYRGTNGSDGALIATLTNNVGSRTSASLMVLGGYNSTNINGPIALPRFWSGSALTLAQLHAEVASYSPVITSNLWTAPAFSGANFTAAMADLSGNSRNWTRSGTDSAIVADPVSNTTTLSPGLLTNSQVFYAPTVTGGSALVAPPLLTNAQSFYAPSISGGAVSTTIRALSFSANALGNSNARLELAGNYRTAFTAIWKSKRGSQTDYYAECWLVQLLGPDNFDGGKYTIGFHPYPSDGTFDDEGQRLAYDSNNHYFEMAGLWQGEGVSQDRIASQESVVGAGNQEAYPTDKSGTAWYTNVATIELISGGTIARHRYYVDFERDPTKVIIQDLAVANIESPTNPAWAFGSPPWMPAGNTSNETPFGKHRYFKLFTAALSESDALLECQSESDSPVSTGGIASALYSNINPTVADVTDKSGEGNDLAWGTAARPADYSEEVLTPPLLANSQTFYAPAVTRGAVTVAPGLLTNSQSFFAPTVGRGTVSLLPGLLSNTQTFYAPTVGRGAVTLAPALFTNAQTFYGPTVVRGAVVLTPGLLTNTSDFYAPVVSAGGSVVQPPLLSNAQTFYSPAIAVGAVTISPSLLTNANTFYSPVVSGGAVVQPPLVENQQMFFAPAVTAGEVELLPPLLANEAIFFGPVVGSGAMLSPPLIEKTSTFYAPTVIRGAVVVSPGLLTNASAIFGPSVITDQVLLAPYFENASTIYPPIVVDHAIEVEVEARFIVKPAPRNWTAYGSSRF